MRLLPNLEAAGVTISLQSPYTCDGHLITNILIIGNELRLETDKGLGYYLNLTHLKNVFEQMFGSYIYLFGESIEENGYTMSIPFHNFETWLMHIKQQCNDLESENPNITEEYCVFYYGKERGEVWFSLLRKLKTQNRASKYEEDNLGCIFESSSSLTAPSVINLSATTPSTNSIETTQITSTGFNRENFISDVAFTEMEERRTIYQSNINTFLTKYIHPHNYKPEFIKHTNLSSSLLLGIEIEVAGNEHEPVRNGVVKKCIQIMNGSDSDEESIIYSTYDSTVQIELDTMPCSLEVHKTLNYKEMFKYLLDCGYRGHDCKNAGMHIHIDRSYLGDTKFKQQLVISKIIYILEKFKEEICVIARKDSSYSEFIGNPGDNPFELYHAYEKFGKRAAVNLQHDETIEFRCFRSTLKYETFILTLEFVQTIVDFAKAINIEEIESISWHDLMRKFPESVQDYYIKRKQREDVQQKDPILKELKKQLKNLKSALSHAFNNMEKTRLRNEIEKVNKQIKQRKADKKKEKGDTGNNNEESTYVWCRDLSNTGSPQMALGTIRNYTTIEEVLYG